MKQIQITRKTRSSRRDVEVDTRTPSGRVLPY